MTNYNETTKYSFTLSNNSYSDQFSLSDGNLKVTNGSGTTRTVDVTISAVNGSNYSNDIPTKDTFRVTFKDNNNSSTTYSGTSGNDTRTLTSGNDTWQVGFGVDKINGGSGSDTINVPNGSKVITQNVKFFNFGFLGICKKYLIKIFDLFIANFSLFPVIL